MIPKYITLQNFLSYRKANLDFNGLHTACICGANGAGKSSLLEAMTWAVWGKTRASAEEEVIHAGEKNTRVDFEFSYNYQTYKVIRTRRRGGGTTLDFQIEDENQFKPISGKGVRATQEKIVQTLRLDYDTFINSAYLRQGKADEFMTRSASQRKEILAELLKLNQYETLANKAKDLAKSYKGKTEELEYSLKDIQAELEQKDAINSQLTVLKTQLKGLQSEQKKAQKKLQGLQEIANQRRAIEKQFQWQESQYNSLTAKCEQIKEEINNIQSELTSLKNLLDEKETISLGYQEFQLLSEKETDLRNKFEEYQIVFQEKQSLEEQLRLESNDLVLAIQREKTNLENLNNQEKDLMIILEDVERNKEDLDQLYYYRQKLNELDSLQEKVSPLNQRLVSLKGEIEKEKTKFNAQLEQLDKQEIELNNNLQKVPQKKKELLQLEQKISDLESQKNYLDRVTEKGINTKNQKKRCEEDEVNLAKQIQELDEKLKVLTQDHAICPLCEQSLDEHHLNHVKQKTSEEKKNIDYQLWQSKQDKINCESEIQRLREEYLQVKAKTDVYDDLKSQYVKLEEQLNVSENDYLKLQEIVEQKSQIIEKLESGNYAESLQQELELLTKEIKKLNYNEKDHSLARQNEKSWRKAEFKKQKIDDAQNEYQKIQERKPLQSKIINDLEAQLAELSKNSPRQLEIDQKQQRLDSLNYNAQEHNEVRSELQQRQIYQSKYMELQQAEEKYPQLENKLQRMQESLTLSEEEKKTITLDLEKLKLELDSCFDNSEELESLEKECEERRQKIDSILTQKGGLEQSLINIENREIDHQNKLKRLEKVKKKYRIYHELTAAFGKNGIQSYMIENILPHLEAEANQILARLTGNQFHIQFITQKLKSSRSKKTANKFRDTLEISISDAKGTRAYETYSGGEAFRINFSIRLALARILAQRSGTSLQLLIIDEGFGTQDVDGCDRLIASLNAIASDFHCILIVTHMPQFKEAFQNRIEISKTDQGSEITLST